MYLYIELINGSSTGTLLRCATLAINSNGLTRLAPARSYSL